MNISYKVVLLAVLICIVSSLHLTEEAEETEDAEYKKAKEQ